MSEQQRPEIKVDPLRTDDDAEEGKAAQKKAKQVEKALAAEGAVLSEVDQGAAAAAALNRRRRRRRVCCPARHPVAAAARTPPPRSERQRQRAARAAPLACCVSRRRALGMARVPPLRARRRRRSRVARALHRTERHARPAGSRARRRGHERRKARPGACLVAAHNRRHRLFRSAALCRALSLCARLRPACTRLLVCLFVCARVVCTTHIHTHRASLR